MKQSFSLLLVLVSIFSVLSFSCKKENETVQFPVSLVLKNISLKGDIHVYTRDGEITDPSLKASAIKSTGVNDIIYNFGPQNDPTATVTFFSDNEFRMGLYEEFSYIKKDNSFNFRKLDSSIGPFHYYTSLIAPFVLYPEMKPTTNGNYIYSSGLIGSGNYTALDIDKLDICLLQKDSVTGNIIIKYSSRNISNVFNKEGIKTLGSKDTIAVREFRFEYR